MADYTLADLWQRMARMIRYANILEVQASPPRCRVTFGSDPITGQVHKSGWLRLSGIADDNAEVWALPAVGASVMVLSPGGELNGGLIFPAGFTDDRAPPSDNPDEYAIRFRNGATVSYRMDSNVMAVSLPEGGKITVDGDAGINGDVSDHTSTMQAMRDLFNNHTHNENGEGGGVTDPPNQKMQSEEEPDP